MINLKYFLVFAFTSLAVSCSNPRGGVVELPHGGDRVDESHIDQLISTMTLEEKVSLLHANGKFTIPAVPRLGIHEMWMSDGPHGVRQEINRHDWAEAGWTSDYSTSLPVLTSVAASWDPEIARMHGYVLGAEARHRGKDFILGPGVNLARNPLYGRNFEYLGEDPFLAAELVVPAVIAIQENDVAATVKHYALNTQELNRTGVDNRPDERTLREVYLPAFEAAVKEGNTWGIMGAYNEVYGTNANQSAYLVNDILKGEWGYQGVLLTDWNVDINTYDAAMNGLDIEMGTDVPTYSEYFLADPLIEMVRDGIVPEAVVDDKVRRILRVQYAIGMYDTERRAGERLTQAHRLASQRIAENGVVLLKNDGVLPLSDAELKSVLVVGPNAETLHANGGGSSQVKTFGEVSPLVALRDRLGSDVQITYLQARGTGGGVVPIAPDYISSRHWTGTPSWRLRVNNQSSGREITWEESWLTESQFNSEGREQDVTMIGTLKPLESGAHRFLFEGSGSVEVILKGRSILAFDGDFTDLSVDAELVEGEELAVEIHYRGDDHVVVGWEAPGSPYVEEELYVEAARSADAVIYVGGLSHSDDREGIDRTSMKLPNQQDEVIQNLLEANRNTVVLLLGGSAVEMPWVDDARALLWGWYGGVNAGHAYTNVIFGDVNPSGRLPITLPKQLADVAAIQLDDYNPELITYPEGVLIGHRWFDARQIDPIFEFGHGLSYTSFRYDDIRLSSDQLSVADASLTVEVDVTNTGERRGAEVVQLYLSDVSASVYRPVTELKGFSKLWLEPGETATAVIELDQRTMSYWDEERDDWKVEPGTFIVRVGRSSRNFEFEEAFELLPESERRSGNTRIEE